MPRITVVSLEGLSSWIAKLGPEDEDVIQLMQTQIYLFLQQAFRKHGGFVFPMSYNNFIVLANSIPRDAHERIYSSLCENAPFRVKVVSVTHPYPFTAQLKASNIIYGADTGFYYEEGGDDDNVILFMDIRGFVKALEITFFESYINFIEIYSNILNMVTRYGGLACYLGGSIILAIAPADTYKKLLDIIPDYVKVGVGISYYPKKAIGLARKALIKLKESSTSGKYLVFYDGKTQV